MILHADEKNFKEQVLDSKVPVLVDFWATWCGPCRMQGSILERLDQEITAEQALIVKIDVDQNPELASQFNVSSIPTLLVFKNGVVTSTQVGVRQEAEVKQMLGL